MMKKRLCLAFLSALALSLALAVYEFGREWNIAAFRGLGLGPRSPFRPALPAFVRYNLPDGLWMLAGLWLLRALWVENRRVFGIYRALFAGIAVPF
jgi:hypothetical protein